VAGFCEYNTETSGPMHAEKFPGKFNNYWFLNKDSVHELVCFFCIFYVQYCLCLGHSKTSEISCV
jgi:hypothetical protein